MAEEDVNARAEREMKEARERLEVGQLWIKYPQLEPGHPNRVVFEVRGFVDNQVIYRIWLKHKQYFYYTLDSLYMFALNIGIHYDDVTWVLAEEQDWAAHGVNPEEDDLVG